MRVPDTDHVLFIFGQENFEVDFGRWAQRVPSKNGVDGERSDSMTFCFVLRREKNGSER